MPHTRIHDPARRDGTIELTDEAGPTRVEIAAWRGGLVSRFEAGGRPVLFLDAATFDDPSKNVRGGIPVLFPTPGKLVNDAWSWRGKSGALKQHGFARTEAWKLARPVDPSTATAVVNLEWASSPQAWPWPCSLELTHSLRGRTLRIEQRVTNRGADAMPFGLGFHPYFHVPDSEKKGVRIDTSATKAFDNVAKREVALARGQSLDLTVPEVDLHLLDHGRTESALRWPGGEVRIRGSKEYTHWVVWTLAGRDFVCLEPWTCPGNALNAGDRLLLLEPDESRSLWLEIEAPA